IKASLSPQADATAARRTGVSAFHRGGNHWRVLAGTRQLWSRVLRQVVHCCPPVRRSERGEESGILLRRSGRGTVGRAGKNTWAARGRKNLFLSIQTIIRGCALDWREIERRNGPRGQRTQTRQPDADRGSAAQNGRRLSIVVGNVRSPDRRRFCCPGGNCPRSDRRTEARTAWP